ncbi:hypothetical protein NG799_10450 [Laspinema sp. D1]|uniref:Uncharacterized protein n=1 Tax=Laspinema palackyanum D2a TaxID=2953684 RepID=A0ABT2MQF9_9CYAN|nr:hypothetical protein [Laspinema sp. D2b]MCT7966752.1 hypothetical protein [Laspinema sp. D2a]
MLVTCDRHVTKKEVGPASIQALKWDRARDVAIAPGEPHPNPDLAKVRGPEVAIAPGEPHPNPDLAKGRGPEVAIAPGEPHPNPDLAKGRGPEGRGFYNWEDWRSSLTWDPVSSVR